MNDKVILVGGFVEIIELCENINIEIIGIIDPIYKHNYLGYPIIGTDLNVKKIKRVYSEIPLTITPDKPDLREKLSVLYMKHGFKFKTLISNQAYISKSALIGSGVVIQNAANISSEVQIGDFVKVNSCANIMHNVDIGQNTTIAPNAVILGYSTIGSGCYIGSNATILPNLQICENIIIGAGAVVTKDIAIPGTKWVGIPARLLK